MDASRRLERWKLGLLEYEFDVVYHPGVKHHAGDTLSPISSDGENKTTLEASILFLALCGAENDEHRRREYVEGSDPCEQFVGILEVIAIAEEKKEVLHTTIEELIMGQNIKDYCKKALATVGHTTVLFDIDRDGVLVRRAPLHEALQKVEPVSLPASLLYLSHYLRLGGHTVGARMYIIMIIEFYWSHMANEAF